MSDFLRFQEFPALPVRVLPVQVQESQAFPYRPGPCLVPDYPGLYQDSPALQALQGKAAGVNIIQNTGAPGSNTTIKIRGTGTVNDADPLYVVDGFIVDDIDYLNPNDIANVEIFKDAASSAVYGARAANGVVAITTKSGEEGKTKIVNFVDYGTQAWTLYDEE